MKPDVRWLNATSWWRSCIRIRSLERRLDDESESRRRSDTIIAQLTQANTALTERLRELEAATDAPDAREGREAGAEDAAEATPVVLQAEQGDAGAPAASLKGSRLVVSQGVAIGVFTAAIIAAAKVIVPVIFGIIAFVVAGVSAIDGNFVMAVISAVAAVVGLLIGFLQERYAKRLRDEERRNVLEMESSGESRGDGGEKS